VRRPAVRTAGKAAHAAQAARAQAPAHLATPKTAGHAAARAAAPNRKAAASHAAPAARHSGSRGKGGVPHGLAHKAPHAKKQWPFLIYDSVTPTAIPGSHHVIATYATGTYAASLGDVAGRKAVLWIDTRGTDPHAGALDVEPGDATPSMAASWVFHRLQAHPRGHAVLYTMRSEWAATQASVRTLPHWMQSHVRWWIADPTGYPHVVPGSNATQWYWGTHYDITTANPGF